jgi:hypothetical protein
LKTRILASRQVLAQVDQVLAQKLSPHDVAHHKSLQEVLKVLRDGRGYVRVSIALAVGGANVPQVSCEREPAPPAKSRVEVPIKIASRTLGALQAESDRTFAAPDHVLLRQVAARLARFLTSRGKALMRHAESASHKRGNKPESRGYQPASAKTASLRMAAGEGRRT